MESSTDRRRGMMIGLCIVALWLAVSAYMESMMANRIPDMSISTIVWAVPTLAGFIAFAYMLNRVANTLAEQNAKLAEAEKATARTAAQLEAVLESIADPMVVTDRQSRVMRANRSFFDTVGGGDELIGVDYTKLHGSQGPRPILHEDGSPFLKSQLPNTRAMAGDIVRGEVLRMRRGDADEYFLASSAPIWDPRTRQITGAVTVLKDISELKRLDRLKDEFISTTSHELRTPLAVIRGFTELQLLAEKRGEADRTLVDADASERIIAEVDRMAGLIDQMLQIARLDAGRIKLSDQETDLAAAIRDEVNTLSVTTTPGRLTLEVDGLAPGESIPCRIDLNAFKQIFGNLISNAVKYSNEASPISVRLSRSRGEALISVADQGVGIPFDELPLIFEKFYRSTNVMATATGLGLGLYIAARLVKLHEGRIWAESTPGSGSTFYVAFPVLQERMSV